MPPALTSAASSPSMVRPATWRAIPVPPTSRLTVLRCWMRAPILSARHGLNGGVVETACRWFANAVIYRHSAVQLTSSSGPLRFESTRANGYSTARHHALDRIGHSSAAARKDSRTRSLICALPQRRAGAPAPRRWRTEGTRGREPSGNPLQQTNKTRSPSHAKPQAR